MRRRIVAWIRAGGDWRRPGYLHSVTAGTGDCGKDSPALSSPAETSPYSLAGPVMSHPRTQVSRNRPRGPPGASPYCGRRNGSNHRGRPQSRLGDYQTSSCPWRAPGQIASWIWSIGTGEATPPRERARVVRRLLVILEPLAGRTTITDLLRERCVGGCNSVAGAARIGGGQRRRGPRGHSLGTPVRFRPRGKRTATLCGLPASYKKTYITPALSRGHGGSAGVKPARPFLQAWAPIGLCTG